MDEEQEPAKGELTVEDMLTLAVERMIAMAAAGKLNLNDVTDIRVNTHGRVLTIKRKKKLQQADGTAVRIRRDADGEYISVKVFPTGKAADPRAGGPAVTVERKPL